MTDQPKILSEAKIRELQIVLVMTSLATAMNLNMSDFKKTNFYDFITDQRFKNSLKNVETYLLAHEDKITTNGLATHCPLATNQIEDYGQMAFDLVLVACKINLRGEDFAKEFSKEFKELLDKHNL